MSTRGLIVAALYACAAWSFVMAFIAGASVPIFVAFSLMVLAGVVYLRGEQLNACECERRRRTGWRLENDITRLERELGIEGDA